VQYYVLIRINGHVVSLVNVAESQHAGKYFDIVHYNLPGYFSAFECVNRLTGCWEYGIVLDVAKGVNTVIKRIYFQVKRICNARLRDLKCKLNF